MSETQAPYITKDAVPTTVTYVKVVALDELHPNPWQPRLAIDGEYIEELALDILSVGRLLQEPMARPREGGGYQLALSLIHI